MNTEGHVLRFCDYAPCSYRYDIPDDERACPQCGMTAIVQVRVHPGSAVVVE